MPLKATGAGELREIDRWDGGVGWIAHPEETMRRASHALVAEGEVWVVDPVDADGVDDLLAEYGEVAGVVVLLDRHGRDADAIARRHGVPVYCPPFVDRSFSAPVARFTGELADTGYRVRRLVDWPGWREGALYDGETLVVADAFGTAPYFTAPGERLGLNPVVRLFPPRSAAAYTPERILLGHGEGIHEDATATLRETLDGARRNLPRALVSGLRALR